MVYDEIAGGPSFWDDDNGVFTPTPDQALLALMGVKAASFDPMSPSTTFATQGNVKGMAVAIRKGTMISKLAVPLNTAGAGLTAVEWGIYDAAYNLLATTGNIAAAVNGITGWLQQNLLSAWKATATGIYYLASSGYIGTTAPQVGILAGLDAKTVDVYPGGVRRTFYGPAQGSLPAVAVPSGTFTSGPLILGL